MKSILLVFIMLMLTFMIADAGERKFMPVDQIKKTFEAMSVKNAVMEDQLSISAKKRLSVLPNAEDIIPKHRLIKKRSFTKEEFIKYEAKGHVDRRECDSVAISQCGGTCTSHGISNAMDNWVCKPTLQISSNEDLWHWYKTYTDDAGIAAAKKNFICEDKDWPNCGKQKSTCKSNRHIQLEDAVFIDDDISKAKRALDRGHPVTYAGRVTKSWANCDKVMNPNSAGTKGGHVVAIVGYKDEPTITGGGYFITLNSWGDDCGDQGYQYLPYEYCKRSDDKMYCSMYEIIKVKSKYANDVTPNPDPLPTPTCHEEIVCARYWWYWLKLRKYCWSELVCD